MGTYKVEFGFVPLWVKSSSPAMVRSETGHSYPPQELLDEETFIVLCDYDHPVPREL